METCELLDNYKNATTELFDQLLLLDEKQIMYFPKRNDSWNIYQHISHLVQTQIESINRTVLFLTKSTDINIISECHSWINATNELNINMPISLALLLAMVNYEIDLLKKFTINDLATLKLHCLYHGADNHMTLLENIESAIFHVGFHHDYIRQNIFDYTNEK